MTALTRPPRIILLKLEAAFWMSRTLLSNLATWTMVLGWLAADPRLHEAGRFAALYGVIILMNGALFIANDILDAEGDALTAPHLPLPSGLLSLRQAWTAVGVCFAASVALVLVAAGGEAGRFALGLVLVVLSIVFSIAYSKVKDLGIVGSLTVAVPQSMPALIAWIMAEGDELRLLVAVLAYCLLASVSNNIIAALRDVDRDPEAGNRTLAVRIGAPAAFRVAAALGFAALVPILALVALAPHGPWALPYALAALAIHVLVLPKITALLAEPERGRTQRLRDLRTFKLGEYVRHTAVAAAFNPVAGPVFGVFLFVCLRGGYAAYTHRLVNGAIRRSLDRLTGSEPDQPNVTTRPAWSDGHSPVGDLSSGLAPTNSADRTSGPEGR